MFKSPIDRCLTLYCTWFSLTCFYLLKYYAKLINNSSIQEDVAIMDRIGFDAYRFSISWSRVLPSKDLNITQYICVKESTF